MAIVTDENGLARVTVPPGSYVADVVQGAAYRDPPAQDVLNLLDEEVRRVTFELVRAEGTVEFLVTIKKADGTSVPIAGVEVLVQPKPPA